MNDQNEDKKSTEKRIKHPSYQLHLRRVGQSSHAENQ